MIVDDLVEGALESAGLPFKRREADWVVPAGGSRPREIVLTPKDGGLRVESVLILWDEIGSAEKEALALFLRRTQTRLRFACCELFERQVTVTSLLSASDLEASLPDAVGAVLAATRLLGREVGALLSTEVAEGYLRFFAAAPEMSENTHRI